MEAMGILAGGIAHDFNNLLTVILNTAHLMRGKNTGGGQLTDSLDQVRHAAERAAELTQQLLAFSRRQVLRPRVLDLNEVLIAAVRMLSRLIGEDVNVDELLTGAI